jgi:diaminopimelate epimerase
MRFVKMHGLGNDYIYVNGFEERVPDPATVARKIADRHFGVGGDGLILVLPPSDGVDAHVRMRMFNADGSEAEMCGNGIRCVCKLAHDRGLSRANPMRIQTGNGVLTLRYTLDPGGRVDRVTVDMGQPVLDPARVPVTIQTEGRRPAVQVDTASSIPWGSAAPVHQLQEIGLDFRMTCVSMGNPHAVFYCKDVARVPLESVGPLIEKHPMFPCRVNVHFVQVHSPGEVTMRTWERGSGVTLACGTGASAVCVAGVLVGKTNRSLLAHLPGGDLTLDWRADDNHVYMTGPATEVFTGDWPEA